MGQLSWKLFRDTDLNIKIELKEGGLKEIKIIDDDAKSEFEAAMLYKKIRHEEIEKAKERVSKKNPSGKYIAYFQNFTNTYGNQDLLIEKFNQAINQENIVGISIGTRPDCLSNEMIKKISELYPSCYQENYPFHISIELGFQTCNENSAKLFFIYIY